jgi:hypothetical protein
MMLDVRIGLLVVCVACAVESNSEAPQQVEEDGSESYVSDSVVERFLPWQEVRDSDGLAVRVVLDPERYPLARCNDGTTPVYYYTPAKKPSSKRWLIHLEGGASCHTDADCHDRWQDTPVRMGTGCKGPDDCSKAYGVAGEALPEFRQLKGVFTENERNFFRDFHRVFVEYCTSDAWTGDGGELVVDGFPHVEQPNRVEFNGHHVVNAVMRDLSNRQGARVNEVDVDLLLSGSSAGSAGAQRHLDRIAAALPKASRVRGVFDAAFKGETYPDFSNNTCSSRLTMGQVRTEPTENQLEKWQTWNPVLDDSCVATAIREGGHPALCFSLDYVFERDEIETSFMIFQAQRDYLAKRGLSEGILLAIGLDPTNNAHRNQCISKQTRDFGRSVAQSTESLEGWYVPCNEIHVSVPRNLVFRQSIQASSEKVSFYDALVNWYSNSDATRFVDDACD